MISIGIELGSPILKLLIDLCVCGPHRDSMGISTFPSVSDSVLNFIEQKLFNKVTK